MASSNKADAVDPAMVSRFATEDKWRRVTDLERCRLRHYRFYTRTTKKGHDMGAWAAGSFDNDDAGDWVCELPEAEDTYILEEAFSRIIECDGYLEAPDCSVAIAAALEPPEQVGAFVSRIASPPSPALVGIALRALQRVKTKSELQELWDESDSRAEWHQAVAELEGRLR